MLTFTGLRRRVKLTGVDQRRLRIGSIFEWVAAASGVVLLIWLISVPAQRLLGPQVEAALVDTPDERRPGVPSGATSVPVLWLLDGREIRVGDLHARLNARLPERLSEGPPHISTGEFGERHTRAYLVDGTRFYVVCERPQRGAPMRVSGVYLP